jgi:hypothetical protein
MLPKWLKRARKSPFNGLKEFRIEWGKHLAGGFAQNNYKKNCNKYLLATTICLTKHHQTIGTTQR